MKNIKDIKELFEKETGLKLKTTYLSDAFYECSGLSYRNILIKIIDFNYKYNTNIYATNNNKSAITIYLR